MKHELTLYYASRAVLSAVLGVIVGLSSPAWWYGLLIGLVVFAGFMWYAHSGNFVVDARTPLFPLRRDERGKGVRDRAVVTAVVVGGVLYGLLGLASLAYPVAASLGWIALLAGVAAYFVSSTWLFRADQ